jgi:hypothetical protein
MAGLLTAHDRRVLMAVNAGASSFSFVGSGFIVLCYVLFKELRKFSFKLVFYLALSVRPLNSTTLSSPLDLAAALFCLLLTIITSIF